jgi:hypothetical protein
LSASLIKMRTYLIGTSLFGLLLATVLSQKVCAQELQTKSPLTEEKCQGLQSPFPDAEVPNQTDRESKIQDEEPKGVTFRKVFTNLPGDQKAIWTSLLYIKATDAAWLAPLAAASGVLIGSDHHSMARAQSNSNAINLSNNVSDAGLVTFAAWPAVMYLWGSAQSEARPRETGLLTGEALINSIAVNEAFKYTFQRERPTGDAGEGRFFKTRSSPSFTSLHSQLSWTAASVMAHEYPDSFTSLLAYGAATTVSIARVTGRDHFPSDVVIGSAMGWLIGRQIYRAHHDPELDTATYGTFQRQKGDTEGVTLGSPYVPLDSWVYPALERLGAMGYIPSQMLGLRPWTRRECIRQIQEAEYFAHALPQDSGIRADILRLKGEFSQGNQAYYSAQIDSVYTRYGRISGTPLRNSYHFGQTLWNDYGRPFDEGNNLIVGAKASATAGRFFFYTQGEFQHTPGRGALTAAQAVFIAQEDVNPVQTPAPINSIDRFYPIDMYAGVQLGHYAFSVGKQSLWLGPTEMGALMMSNNADPMYSVRLTRTEPLVLPSFLRLLGPVREEIMFAKLSGHQFPARPFFNLQKITFHPTENLELGFTRASLWAGVGHPFTFKSLAKNFGSVTSPNPGNTLDRNDPGDRKAGFDFSYKLPGLRRWLTLYSDAYADDDPSPLDNPRRAAFNPGIYLTHVPGIAKLDLRTEATSTQLLTQFDLGPTFLYWNDQYRDSNTNKGALFGNQTGRDNRAYQGWSTYHFSAETDVAVSFREVKASIHELPGGGTQSDAFTRFRWQVRPNLMVDAFVQYERWVIPVVKPGAQHDVTGQWQVTWQPHWEVKGDQ